MRTRYKRGMEPGRLVGKRVLVTRPRGRALELCFLLEDEGAEVLTVPVLELLPPQDPRPLRAAAEHVQRYAWIAFASPLAVDALVDAVRQAGTSGALGRVRIAAVGPRTAKQAQNAGLTPVVTVESGGGEALAEAMRPLLHAGDEVLLPAAEHGRDELHQALADAGAQVTRVVAYRSERTPIDPPTLASLREAPPDAVIFGSPRTAEAFLEALGEGGRALTGRMRRVAIGSTTAHALEHLGLAADAVATAPTPEGLLDATIRAVHG